MIHFEESEMRFEFDDGNCFRVEEDPLVKGLKCSSTSNNKGCECVSVIDGSHCFIEAKQSTPQQVNGDVAALTLNGKPMPDQWVVYDNIQCFLRNISKKFTDSFYITRALCEGRHGSKRQNSVPLPNKHIDPDNVRFILIINLYAIPNRKVDKQGLHNLQDALKNEMRPFLKIWNIPDTAIKVVLPDAAAQLLNVPLTLLSAK